jgi:hypothetical protein
MKGPEESQKAIGTRQGGGLVNVPSIGEMGGGGRKEGGGCALMLTRAGEPDSSEKAKRTTQS